MSAAAGGCELHDVERSIRRCSFQACNLGSDLVQGIEQDGGVGFKSRAAIPCVVVYDAGLEAADEAGEVVEAVAKMRPKGAKHVFASEVRPGPD